MIHSWGTEQNFQQCQLVTFANSSLDQDALASRSVERLVDGTNSFTFLGRSKSQCICFQCPVRCCYLVTSRFAIPQTPHHPALDVRRIYNYMLITYLYPDYNESILNAIYLFYFLEGHLSAVWLSSITSQRAAVLMWFIRTHQPIRMGRDVAACTMQWLHTGIFLVVTHF